MAGRVLTPLGALLEHARTKVLGISASEAARRARMSESRWRQIVTGIQAKAGGHVPVNAPVRKVVAMALAVDVDPAEAVRVAGQTASAESLAAIIKEMSEPSVPDQPGLAAEIARVRALPIDPDEKIQIVQALIGMWAEKGDRQRAG